MSISSISASLSAASSTAATDQATIADNFDTFLTLLTTQLKNQNPLDPLDTNEFTAQLVQFTGVEQQIKMNDKLEDLSSLFQESTLTSSVNYIGKTVTGDGDTTILEDGSATWEVNFDEAPEESQVVITNESGTTIFTGTVDFDEGSNTYTWDGLNTAGGTATDGLYTINVSATDADGATLEASTQITGVVTGVDLTGEDGMLTLGDLSIKIDDVQKIEA